MGLNAFFAYTILGYSWLLAKRVRGALLVGIIITTLIGIPMGLTDLPDQFISLSPSINYLYPVI